MKVGILALTLLFSFFFILACSETETLTGNVVQEPEKTVCNKPYFEFRENDCCLDKNDNSICDSDEKSEDVGDEVAVEKETTEKAEIVDEVKQYDVYVSDKEGFDPQELTITKGDNVSWRNEGHRGMILLVYKDNEPYLNQNFINPKDRFVLKFNELGTYDIYWNIARGPVKGKVIVKEKSPEVIETQTKKDYAKKGEYTEEQLEEDLTDIFETYRYEVSNFTRDPSHPEYIQSSDLKYHVIHTIRDKQIKNFEDFCEIYCGENWDGINYFINKSYFDSYIPLLDEGNFSTEAEYKQYIKDRILGNHTEMEQIIGLKNGKILEYRFFLVETDTLNNFLSNLIGYQLIYKIPCSHNLTVFLRPRWEDYSVRTGSGGVSGVIRNWILEDERAREGLLEQADKILDRCPVEEDFFESYDFENYFFSELLAYYWKTHYMYQFNISNTLSIGVEKKSKLDEAFLLKEVNVSFTNNDYYDLDDMGLRIVVRPDDNRNEKTYIELDNAISKLSRGKTLVRNVKKEEVEFSNNITVKATIYIELGSLDVRSIEKTFTLEDLGFD